MSLPQNYNNIGSSNTVFGTAPLASGSLANQLIENLNFTVTAEKLEVKDNSGAVVDVYYFNQTANGSFNTYFKSTGDYTGSVASNITLYADMGSGSTAKVVIDSLVKTWSHNNVVMRTHNFTYYPNVVFNS